jgi:tetratricopeptide (TPR) repeat protein
MPPTELDRLRHLRASGALGSDDYLAALRELADRSPGAVDVQIALAEALADQGLDQDALAHYERCWQLEVPEPLREPLLIGHGAALRAVGRADDAAAVLARALEERPHAAALEAFLALALHDAGHIHAALATLLDLSLTLGAGSDAFGSWREALAQQRDDLLDRALTGGLRS